MVGKVADLCLSVAQLADVPGGRQQARLAVQNDGLDRNFNGDQIPRSCTAQHFVVQHSAMIFDREHQPVVLLLISPDRHVVHLAAQHVLDLVAGQTAKPVVDLDVAPIGLADDADGVGAGMKGLGELLFRIDQPAFAFDLLIDRQERVSHWSGDARVVTVKAPAREQPFVDNRPVFQVPYP